MEKNAAKKGQGGAARTKKLDKEKSALFESESCNWHKSQAEAANFYVFAHIATVQDLYLQL